MRDYNGGVFYADNMETLITDNKIKQGSRLLVFYLLFSLFFSGKTTIERQELPRFNRPEEFRFARRSSTLLYGSGSRKMSHQGSSEEINYG